MPPATCGQYTQTTLNGVGHVLTGAQYNLEQNRIEKQTPGLPSREINGEMREPREGQNFPILKLGLGSGG